MLTNASAADSIMALPPKLWTLTIFAPKSATWATARATVRECHGISGPKRRFPFIFKHLHNTRALAGVQLKPDLIPTDLIAQAINPLGCFVQIRTSRAIIISVIH